MTRQEQLKWCKICKHQKKSLEQGIICGLTNRIADFQGQCQTFVENPMLKAKIEENAGPKGVESKIASQGQRFANYIIDWIFVTGFAMLFGVAIGLLGEFVDPNFLNLFYEDNPIVDWLFGSIITVIYYAFFEGITGRSIGKFFTKTKVVTVYGESPDFKTIFIRSLCRCIPFNALSFLGNDSVGWHDKFSETRVIEMD